MPGERPYLGSASPSYALAVLDYFEQIGDDPQGVFGAERVRSIRQETDAQRLSVTQWQNML